MEFDHAGAGTAHDVVRKLGLGKHDAWSPDEAVARLAAAQAALDRLEEIEGMAENVPENVVERLREIYQARFARCVAALSGEDGEVSIEDPLKGFRRLRRELIASERGALLKMRSDGRLKQDIFRRIQSDLDLEEARLRS